MESQVRVPVASELTNKTNCSLRASAIRFRAPVASGLAPAEPPRQSSLYIDWATALHVVSTLGPARRPQNAPYPASGCRSSHVAHKA